jgi:phosphoglycerol transferase
VSTSSSAHRNLVLIYLESVEQNYFDETLFPGLMPNLSKLKDDAIWFEDVHQYPGTGWTIAGLVSSQCGVPLLSDGHGNRILEAVDNPFRQITCLAEFLKDDGYDTAYLGGATLNFAGKGRFLNDNGYQLTLGIDELPKASRHSWGMFDNDLFAHGKELFDALAEDDAPFFLTMLTLDTHHPYGTPSPGCPMYADASQTMVNAVHCADYLVADFVSYIQASRVAQNTVVALVSDHLLMNGATIDLLSSKERRLTFILLDPLRRPERYSGSATHFDVAPTLLDALGRSDASFPFGHSLLQHEAGRVFERQLTDQDFQGFKIEKLISYGN